MVDLAAKERWLEIDGGKVRLQRRFLVFLRSRVGREMGVNLRESTAAMALDVEAPMSVI